MANLIPTIRQAGIFEVLKPFNVLPSTVYECAALVDFKELNDKGTNIFQVYYAPYGLSKSTYEDDVKNGVVIVTLKAIGKASVTLPSSYIKSLPKTDLVPFNLFIVSASITAPDNTEFDALSESMARAIGDNFGVSDPEITITQVPTRSYMTSEEAKIVEANRVAGITNHDTLRTENARLNDMVSTLQSQVAALSNLLAGKA